MMIQLRFSLSTRHIAKFGGRRFLTTSTIASKDGPLAVYSKKVISKSLKEDSHQLAALVHLQQLYEDLIVFDEKMVNYF